MRSQTLAFIPLFAALTAAGALLKIPLWPVAITMQNFCVVLAGILLGPGAGALSQLVYLLVGFMGLPVFSGGGGPSYVMQPSFGYLLGFILAPVVAGACMRRRPYTRANVLIAALLGMLAIYFIGVPYLAGYLKWVIGKPEAIRLAVKTGLLVFLPGDIVKCLLLTLIVPRLMLRPAGKASAHARPGPPPDIEKSA